MKKTFLLLAVIFPFIAFALPCDDFLTQLEAKNTAANTYDFTPQETMFLTYSAKPSAEPVDLGDEDKCQSSDLMKYFVAIRSLNMGLSVFEERGVCLPIECDNPEELKSSTMIQHIYRVLKWPYGSPQETYELYDQTVRRSKDFYFYLVVSILIIFLALNIVGTVYTNYIKNRGAPPEGGPSEKDRILSCFDLKKNIADFYQTAKEQNLNESVAVFGCLRLLASYLVILHHFSDYVVTNGDSFLEALDTQLFGERAFPVEYFFIMAGFLAAYTLVPKIARIKFSVGTYFDLLRHRIVRIWPILFLGLFFNWKVLYHLSGGPRWYRIEKMMDECSPKTLFFATFFMSNLQGKITGDYDYFFCDSALSWYIAVETQTYLFCILVAAAFAKSRRFGYGMAIALTLQSLIQAIVYCGVTRIDFYEPTLGRDSLLKFEDHFQYITCKRWYSYFIGMIWGFMYFEYNKLKKENMFKFFENKPIVSFLTMILGTAVIISTYIIPLQRLNWSPVFASIWVPLRLLILTIGAIMVFTPLMADGTSIFKRFCNARFFQVLGKTCYTKYMFHYPWIYLIGFGGSDYHDPNGWNRFLMICVFILVCQTVATILYLTIENPILKLDVYLEIRKKQKAV